MRLLKMMVSLALISAMAQVVHASCPEAFQQEFRKLHSTEKVLICDLMENKVTLIVNTASHCGYTRQFSALEKLYQQLRDKGLQVIGFASDDFNQEAKDEAQAASVCFKNYGVTFTMIAPSHVKGTNANPVFKTLAEQSAAPKWNFNKYLVGKDGKLIKHFGSAVEPDNRELMALIEASL